MCVVLYCPPLSLRPFCTSVTFIAKYTTNTHDIGVDRHIVHTKMLCVCIDTNKHTLTHKHLHAHVHTSTHMHIIFFPILYATKKNNQTKQNKEKKTPSHQFHSSSLIAEFLMHADDSDTRSLLLYCTAENKNDWKWNHKFSKWERQRKNDRQVMTHTHT